jgi:putative tricarboxylic transport membrane protein
MKNNVMDIVMMFIFGIIGYLLRKLDFELGPLLLAFVLGRILERSLRQALLISNGSFMVFITKPISGMLLGLVVLLLVMPVALMLYRRFIAPKPQL